MKYCVLIVDGASGLPLPERGGRTTLELARTPGLDAMVAEGLLGLASTVPEGMEPSSACACMSVFGYNPEEYYRGRAGIEALSMGVPVGDGEAVFRCNLVSTSEGRMQDYSAGHISNEEAGQLIGALNEELGNAGVRFYPGIGYRHVCKLSGREETLRAVCTPPHDIPGKPVADFLPRGEGSEPLKGLMLRSEAVLRGHPVNVARRARGEALANMIWLFWGTGGVPALPPFEQVYGLKAALTAGVDLLRGLGRMMGMDILDIPGVTDGPDSDHAAQISGALKALDRYGLVAVHIEAPDEAAHAGSAEGKIAAIEQVDRDVAGCLRDWMGKPLRVLIMPDHPTPVATRTHGTEPVPFLLWGAGISSNGASRFTEVEAAKTGLFLEQGYNIMSRLVGRD